MAVYIVTFAFSQPHVVEKALERMRATTKGVEYKHILVDCHYPYPNKVLNREGLEKLSKNKSTDYLLYLDKNHGVAGNYNQLLKICHFNHDDVIAFFDPDNDPATDTWLEDACKLLAHEQIAYVSLCRPDPDVPWGEEATINGVRVYQIYRGHSWPMGIYSGRFFNRVSGLQQPNKFFGYVEDTVFRQICEQQMIAVFMRDHIDRMHDGDQDAPYLEWQSESARRVTDLGFEEWLQEKKII